MTPFWRRFCIRFCIYWCIFWITAPIFTIFAEKYYRFLYTNIYLPQSYISAVNTPYYSNEWTRVVLQEFNSMADNKAVRFQRDVIDRPITIEEKDDLELAPPMLDDPNTTTIGLAISTLKSCKIYLKTGLSYGTFRTVLLHEYLHCLDFDHVTNDKNDLMAPKDGFTTEENIKGYAEKAAKKLWKNSKN